MKEANEDENFKGKVAQEKRGWCTEAYEEAYRAAADQAEYGAVDLNSVSAFPSPICHFNPQSARISRRYSHHQQRDSVTSMQQFYYRYSYRDDDRPRRYQSWDFYSDSQESQQYKYVQDHGSPSTAIVNELQLQELRTLSSSPEQIDEEVDYYVKGGQGQAERPAISNNTRPDLTQPNTPPLQPLNSTEPSTSIPISTSSLPSPPSPNAIEPACLNTAVSIAHSQPALTEANPTPLCQYLSSSTVVVTLPSPPCPPSPLSAPTLPLSLNSPAASTSNTTLRRSPCFILPLQTAKMRFPSPSLEQHQAQYSLEKYPTANDPSKDIHTRIDTLSPNNAADAIDVPRVDSENPEALSTVDPPMDPTASQFTIIQFNKTDSGIEQAEEVILPTSKNARGALMASIVLALVSITLEAILLYRHRVTTADLVAIKGPFKSTFFRPLMIYYTIFIIGEIFAVGLLWDAAIHKNSLQLVAFTLFEWCIVSYSGLQIWQHDQLVKNIEISDEMLVSFGDSTTRMILFSQLGFQITACLGITLLTWKLYSEFGWLIFQKLGADVSLRKMMKEYRMLFTLLKLDSFMFFGYAIQVAALTDEHWKKGLIEVAFAIPLSGIVIFLGYYAMRNENKVTMGGFIACLGLLIGYMTYRLVALNQTITGSPDTDPFFFSRKTMTVFAALTLFMTVLALINAIVMFYNFNRGLKEAMQQYRVRRSSTVRSTAPSVHQMSVAGPMVAGGVIGNSNGSGSSKSVGARGGAGDGRWGNVQVRRGGSLGTTSQPLRNSPRMYRRSLIHCESSQPTTVVVERWQIE
ncbi:hypothetical protein BG011_006794 [Mortierella polycephala]|uniref:Uncharacterized protein n=1 Tax=Mortierella polycephala TaxID=41804 RepID=A0A9P6QCU1_9FUNG|nr:hypothetical protein BG011_006794 [Mortierella polycephala]